MKLNTHDFTYIDDIVEEIARVVSRHCGLDLQSPEAIGDSDFCWNDDRLPYYQLFNIGHSDPVPLMDSDIQP